MDGVVAVDGTTRGGRGALTERVHDKDFRVSGSGFWQVHPAAASTLVDAVLAGAMAKEGDVVADLYAGVGLFTAFLADAVGESGTVISVESDQQAAKDARRNLHGSPQVKLVGATVERALREGLVGAHVDVVVLDPPRTGAKKVVRRSRTSHPDESCTSRAIRQRWRATWPPSTALGYTLDSLRAFALFPMTHHVECVAVLVRK